jgi:hypothetical protein
LLADFDLVAIETRIDSRPTKVVETRLALEASSLHRPHEPPVIEPVGFLDEEARVHVFDAPLLALIDALRTCIRLYGRQKAKKSC